MCALFSRFFDQLLLCGVDCGPMGHTMIQKLVELIHNFLLIDHFCCSIFNRCQCPIAIIAFRVYDEYAASHVLRSQLENIRIGEN